MKQQNVLNVLEMGFNGELYQSIQDQDVPDMRCLQQREVEAPVWVKVQGHKVDSLLSGEFIAKKGSQSTRHQLKFHQKPPSTSQSLISITKVRDDFLIGENNRSLD